MRSLHWRGRETKKLIFLSSSRLCLMGWVSFSLEILQVCSWADPGSSQRGTPVAKRYRRDFLEVYRVPPKHVTCHVSRVTCHVSPVTCHMSHVSCHVSFFFCLRKKIGQSGGASRWRVCYQRGLPRLVLQHMTPVTWHMTCDTWHMTCDIGHMTNMGWSTLSQNIRSLALTVWEWMCFEDIFTRTDSVVELPN